MNNGAVIELQNLVFSYGQARVLEQIDLTISGGVYGLLGPNGAGKTTLIKILLGFLTPQEGIGHVLGRDITRERKELRRHIGYMPETDSFIPGMDAVGLTAYLGELSGMPGQEAIKRAHEVLYYVGLEESRYRKVETYSVGMKQRLKLAMALVHDPRLLFLDEPTSGMDPKGRKEMLELVRDIAVKQSMNIIISSHLLPDIESTCSRVIILNQGKIARELDISDVATERFNRFEIKVKGNPEPLLSRFQELSWTYDVLDRGLIVILLPREKKALDLFRLAREQDIQIRHFVQSRTSLEDSFVSAVGAADGH